MKWIAGIAIVAALGCQRDSDKPAPTQSVRTAAPGSAYAKDIEALCDAVKRSGAEDDPGARQLTIANWLAANLTTPESRQFLVKIQPLVGEEKAQALETEAKRVGLPGCPLAAEWRTPATP